MRDETGRRFILSLAAALVLPGLTAGPGEAIRPTDIVAVDDFIDAARTVFGRTRGQVERGLGSPSEVRARTLADGVGPPDAVDELIYPGVTIFVSRRSTAVRAVVV